MLLFVVGDGYAVVADFLNRERHEPVYVKFDVVVVCHVFHGVDAVEPKDLFDGVDFYHLSYIL